MRVSGDQRFLIPPPPLSTLEFSRYPHHPHQIKRSDMNIETRRRNNKEEKAVNNNMMKGDVDPTRDNTKGKTKRKIKIIK
jgi:hypothetical protein